VGGGGGGGESNSGATPHFSLTSISKMNDKVNAYNKKLAGLVTDEEL